MADLDTRNGALPGHEPDNARERLDMIIRPDAQTTRRDAPLRHHRRRLHDNEAGAPRRSRAEVDQMRIVGQAVPPAVLTHGGNPDPVAERHTAKRELIEQVRHLFPQFF